MKSLMDVIKTLLQINLGLALLAFLIVIAVRERQSRMVADISPIDNQSQTFQRNFAEIPSEDQQKLAESSQKIAKLTAKLQEKDLTDQKQGQIIDHKQQIVKLAAKSQEKDQQIQQLQRQLAAYQKSPIAEKKSVTKENHPDLAKNTNTQLSSHPSPIVSVNQNRSPVQLSQKYHSESRASKNSFVDLLASVPPKTEITPPLAPTSGTETLKESTPNLATAESETPLSNELKEDYQLPQKAPLKLAVQPKTIRDQSIDIANDLAAGLQVADKTNYIKYGTRTYRKVQTAIGSLRQVSSTSLERAAQISGLKPSILAKVAQWGQDRPGSFESNDEISFAPSN
jgi:hypothetical protein